MIRINLICDAGILYNFWMIVKSRLISGLGIIEKILPQDVLKLGIFFFARTPSVSFLFSFLRDYPLRISLREYLQCKYVT